MGTIRQVLHDKGYNSRIAWKKPYISKVNRLKHLEFTKNYVNYDQNCRYNLIFSPKIKNWFTVRRWLRGLNRRQRGQIDRNFVFKISSFYDRKCICVYDITISYVVNKSESLDNRNSVLDNQHIVALLIKLLLYLTWMAKILCRESQIWNLIKETWIRWQNIEEV